MGDSVPDDAFRALENEHRRRLLFALFECDEDDEVPVSDAVDAHGHGGRDVRLELYHVHLPMLEDRGFVAWDLETNHVGRGPKFDGIRPLLELLDRHRDDLPDGWL